jgi:hypothetical protein
MLQNKYIPLALSLPFFSNRYIHDRSSILERMSTFISLGSSLCIYYSGISPAAFTGDSLIYFSLLLPYSQISNS